jgi:ferrous iron transport protein B
MSVVALPEQQAVATDRVALLGNPNTGKTTIFNSLCGVRAKTANFPGTTTTVRVGQYRAIDQQIHAMDLPGVYELNLATPEAQIARDAISGARGQVPGAIVVVVDACNLTRNLVLVGELLEYQRPVVVALNMMDLAARRGVKIDAKKLGQRLGVTVVPTVARSGEGLDALRAAIAAALAGPGSSMRPVDLPAQRTPETLTTWAESLVADVASSANTQRADALSERVDRMLTHPVYGMAAFAAVMGLLFWTLFTLATIPMDLIEGTFGVLGDATRSVFPAGPVQDLIADGIVGGVAGTVVFLPQICLLFFLISLLEDTGYLARAAFVMDRLLSRFGLPGHSFVPLLTAHACAIPSIMSTRLIPDRRDRLATILIAPFMSCSARLPVYVLLTSLIFADRPALAALAFGACYLLGGTAALLSAVLFGRTVLKGRAQPMVLELPTYKVPSLANALLSARDQGLMFLKTAGTVIVAICIVMWWLSTYPRVEPGPEVQTLRAQAEAPGLPPAQAEALTLQADTLERRAAQAGTFAGMMGRIVEPVFRPLGFDWQLTVGVLTSFLAREVFVSTMSVLVGGSGDTEADEGVIARIRGMTTADGRLVFTPATAAAALVFFVLAMQCLPTLAVTRREAGGLKYAAFQFAYMSGVAYVGALVVHQALRAAGVV